MSESLESSLPVPSVQEIARQSPDTVPARYIRDDLGSASSDLVSSSAPVIDLSELVNSDSSQRELQKLHSACRDWGIFQLINHGISGECLSSMKKSAEEFFALPLEEKKRWGQEAGSLEGYGQAFVTSEEQKLDWNDMIFIKALPVRNRNSRLWPQLPPNLKDALGNYSASVADVTVCLIKLIGKALGIEETRELEESLMDGNYEIRLNCYPPCVAPDRVIGMAPHADMSAITVLLECGDGPGLQVFKDGKWVFIQPMQGALVVNLGQILQVVSNGIYKAPEHRALVNRGKERLSVVTFCYPNPDAIIGPAKELVGAETPALYKTLSVEDYFHCFYNRELDAPFIDALRL